jgi:ribosomal protection tetracycline resistance protein
MIDGTLNLGILAHVDAGKTSLTERLLYQHGVIRSLGSVDEGNTTTDSGELERERGITIRSAVASFNIDLLRVNLVDTPGHPDFIAEVERALSVLDGVVLVVSAVEGVQAQTKVLMRSLRRINMPTMIFINKIDRMGARTDALLAEIKQRLTPNILPMNTVADAGGPNARIDYDATVSRQFRPAEAETIIENDERLLARMLDGQQIPYDDLIVSLAAQTRSGALHPVYFGSALVSIGIDTFSQGIKRFLPSTPRGAEDGKAPQGIVFSIQRSYVGDKIAYVRLFEGSLKERQTVTYSQWESNGQVGEHEETASAIELVAFESEKANGKLQANHAPKTVQSGDIAKVRGLSAVRVGARLGKAEHFPLNQHFPPPNLETIVHAQNELLKTKLHSALIAMSDEDPLIQARVMPDGGLSIQLYGEVQKEIIRERLKREHRIDAVFSETQPIYFERPIGIAESYFEYDKIDVRGNIFPITIGLRIEPNTIGGGNQFIREAKWGLMPAGFYRTIEESAMRTLSQGLYGWKVTDCIVYLTQVAYERPLTVAAHFRYLTAILLMRALKEAKTQVYEPHNRFELDVPDDVHGSMIGYLATQGAEIEQSEQSGASSWLITGSMPARIVQQVTREIPGLTRGEGMLVSLPGSDHPMRGNYPLKERMDGNPLDYDNYMKYLGKNKLL